MKRKELICITWQGSSDKGPFIKDVWSTQNHEKLIPPPLPAKCLLWLNFPWLNLHWYEVCILHMCSYSIFNTSDSVFNYQAYLWVLGSLAIAFISCIA